MRPPPTGGRPPYRRPDRSPCFLLGRATEGYAWSGGGGMQERSAGPPAGAGVAGAGGPVGSGRGFTPVPWKGSQSVAGKLVLLAGVVVAGVGVASLSRLPVERPLAAVALAGGMAAGVLAILVALTLDGRVADDVVAFYMRQLAMPGAAAQSLVDGAVGPGQV